MLLMCFLLSLVVSLAGCCLRAYVHAVSNVLLPLVPGLELLQLEMGSGSAAAAEPSRPLVLLLLSLGGAWASHQWALLRTARE